MKGEVEGEVAHQVGDALDVQSTCADICADQDIYLFLFKGLQGLSVTPALNGNKGEGRGRGTHFRSASPRCPARTVQENLAPRPSRALRAWRNFSRLSQSKLERQKTTTCFIFAASSRHSLIHSFIHAHEALTLYFSMSRSNSCGFRSLIACECRCSAPALFSSSAPCTWSVIEPTLAACQG